MSKSLQILKQIDDEEIAKAFAEAKKNADSPEAINRIVDNIVKKAGIDNAPGKAYLSNWVNAMLLGEAAFDEIPELSIMSPEERALKLREVSYGGLDKLRDSVESKILKYPKLGNKIEISPEYNPTSWGKSNLSGIYLNQPSEVPLNFLTAVNLHEYGHQFDDATRLALRKLKDLQMRDLKNPEVKKDYEKTKEALLNLIKKYPETKSTIQDKDLSDFKSRPYSSSATEVAEATGQAILPSELEKELIKDHMFKRNYEFDNLLKALKGGMKTVKGVGIGMIPAAAAGALAAYSPDSMAGETAKTALKVMDEGDPLSLLTPPSLNENEEKEIQKMIEEQKAKQSAADTADKWYGQRWSKIKDLVQNKK
jgi:hypothetical protein